MRHKEYLIILLALALAAFLYMSFGLTDLMVDEAYHSILSHELAIIMLHYLPFVAAAAVFGMIVLYIIIVKRNLYFTAALAASVIAIKYIFNIPTSFHFIHPPLFNITEAFLLLLSPDMFATSPRLAGIAISSASIVFLSLSAFFVLRRLNEKRAGLVTAVLLLLSPVAVFFSTTSMLNPLAVALAYSSLLFFALGMKEPKFLPLSGLLMAAAAWTRFDILLVLLGHAALAFANRDKIAKAKEFHIFLVVVGASIIVQLPFMLSSSQAYAGYWQHETFTVELLHYSTYVTGAMGSDPMVLSPLFYAKMISIFYTPLILITFVLGLLLALRSRSFVAVPAAIGLLYMIGFSFSSVIQTDRYMLLFDFPLILATGFLISRAHNHGKRFSIALIVVVLAAFAFSDSSLIDSAKPNWVWKVSESIPNSSVVYSDQPDVVLYDTSGYLCKMQGCTNNPRFWEQFIPADVQAAHNISVKFSYGFDKLSLMKMSDYFIVSEFFFANAPDDHKSYLSAMNKCYSLVQDGRTLYTLYARGECPPQSI